MSEAQREESTATRFAQLEKNRELKRLAEHTEEESAFYDAQATLARVENEVKSTL